MTQQELSSLDKAEPLDDDEVRRRVHTIIEDRNQRMKDAVENMYALLQQVTDMLQEFASAHDQAKLEDMERELDTIKRMETHQEHLRGQVVRFIQATSSSFQEIFNESPTPP